MVYDGKEVAEEFVETEYYKDLNSVDKHHHTVITSTSVLFLIILKIFKVFFFFTNLWICLLWAQTGKGFIQVEKSDTSFHIEPDNDSHECHQSSKGNPATNDWVPAPFTEVFYSFTMLLKLDFVHLSLALIWICFRRILIRINLIEVTIDMEKWMVFAFWSFLWGI